MAIRFLACLVLVARLFTDSGVALGRELARTKISPSRGRFEVLCRVDQREQRLLFDTGSADCCLAREFCERHLTLHGRVAVSAANEIYFTDRFKGCALKFDQMTVSQPLIVVHDRRSLPRCGIGSDGLMGMSIFADKVIQLDWKQGALRVFDQYDPEEGDEALELRLLYGTPSIRGHLSGWRDLILDTGNEAPISLTPVLLDELVKKGEVVVLPFAGSQRRAKGGSRFLLRELGFGSFCLPDVQGVPMQHNTLGAPVLSRFRVTLDFPNKKAYFKPRTDLPDRDPPDAAGLLLRRDQTGTYVYDVRFDSPAQEAGLKIDDRLISVNGEDADKAAFFRLYEMLSQGGQSATLVYERKKQSQTVVLKLRHPIPWPPVWPEKKPIRKIPDEE